VRRKHSKKRNKNKKITKRIIFGIITFLTLLAGTGIGYYIASFGSFFNQISDNPEEISTQDYRLDNAEPFSILLLGLDHASSGNQTDTIMVATVNPEQESIDLVSIPRDTVVYSDSGAVEKINSMYAMGGIDQITNTVEDVLEIPISFYAVANFEAVIDVVNAVEGITVDSDFSFTVQDSEENSGAIEIEEGVQELNGEEALGYARMRYQDPQGDFGRQQRQQEVISAILDELVSLNTLTNFDNILSSVSPHVKTNVTGRQSLMIAANYQNAVNNLSSLSIEGTIDSMFFPHYGFNVSVYRPDFESVENVRQKLQSHLGIENAAQASSQELLEEDGLGQNNNGVDNQEGENLGSNSAQEPAYEVFPNENDSIEESPEQTNPYGNEEPTQEAPNQTNPYQNDEGQESSNQTSPYNNEEPTQEAPTQNNPYQGRGQGQEAPTQTNPYGNRY